MSKNPLFDSSTDNQEINEDTQKRLNTALASNEDYTVDEQTFVDLILKLVGEETINPYQPGTLINHSVYDGLSDEAKGLADQNAMNMLGKIRQVISLSKLYEHPTYQMKNLVAALKQNKEQLEEHSGDIFII
ncbi:MAG: hypothetical protein ACI9QC_000469 [Oceanicoccus sp.]|jgi:hypothetical protein